jgi:UDP-glucuronate decarboxylase
LLGQRTVTHQIALSLHSRVADALNASARPVVLIGSGGWMGQAALAMVAGSLGDVGLKRTHIYGSRARSLTLAGGQVVQSAPLAALAELKVQAPLVLHFAFLTRDKVSGLSLDDYVASNGAISDAVAAFVARTRPVGLVLPSSGAVYGSDRVDDTALAINPYGVLKLRDEVRFANLAEDMGMAAAIGRVFNVSGPYINKVKIYALASILLDILMGAPVSIRARHRVVRAYTHMADALNVMMARALDSAAPGSALFDVAGQEPVEVGELAQRALAVLHRPDLAIVRDSVDQTKEDRYLGDPSTFAALAASYGIALQGLDLQITDTAAYLATLLESGADLQ